MKILKIELQNINSLKCETPIVIDFEQQRFEDVGLFAITGPTGAGKTTLLDAITIALYRKVPRFEKSGSAAKLEDVVSYGATTAMARVTFIAQNQRYEAQWDMRLASSNGKLLGKPVETVRLKNLTTVQILAETKTNCDERIVEITQLNYDQFLRSVLLAQGEFAAFLSAKNSEKGLLLQQIAGDEIYRKIGEALKNRIFDEKKRLEQIRSKINTDDLLSQDVVNQLLDEDKQLNESVLALTIDLKKLDDLLKWYERMTEFQLQKQKIEADKLQLALDVEQQSLVFQQLVSHEAAEPIKPVLTEVLRLEQEIAKKADRIQSIDSELIALELKLKEATTYETDLKTKTIECEQFVADWQPKLDNVIALDTNIRSHATAIADKKKAKEDVEKSNTKLVQSLDLKAKELNLHEKDIATFRLYFKKNENVQSVEKQLANWSSQLTLRKSNWDRIQELNKNILKFKADFAENTATIERVNKHHKTEKPKSDLLALEIKQLQERLDRNDVQQLVLHNNSLNDRKEQLRILIQIAVKQAELLAGQKNLAEQKAALEKLLNNALLNVQQFDAEIIIALQSVKDAEELYEKDRYIVSLEAERKKLILGEPCALCGSTVHPLVEHYAEIQVSESKKRLDERHTKLEKLNVDKKNIELEQSKLNADLQNVSKQLATADKDLTELQTKFADFNSEFKITDVAEIEILLKSVENEQATLSTQIAGAHDLQKLKNQKEEDAKAIEAKIKTFELQLTQLTTANLGIGESISTSENEYALLNVAMEDIERLLVARLADCDLQLPEIPYTDKFIQHLEQSIKEYNVNLKKQAEADSAVQQCQLEIKNLNQQIADKYTEIKLLDGQLVIFSKEYQELIQNRIVILPMEISTDNKRTELQAVIDKAKKTEQEATKQLADLKHAQTVLATEKMSVAKQRQADNENLTVKLLELNTKIEQSSFAHREELRSALLADDVKMQYLKIRKEIDDRNVALRALEKNTEAELEKLETSLKPDVSQEETLAQKAQNEQQKEKLQKRVGEIAESFRKDAQIKERNAGVVAEIQAQEQVCRKWTDLMTVLGGSQDAFNTYVQRLTLKNLIDLANLHLYNLNRRYSLQLNAQYKPGEELNFKLVDHYQADEARLVDTSSGGEKFLISLSLALGLSDLASHNVSIGSLFIDEGFGTLDSNTLETVISTLETLKAQGKTIGIISHVDSLKERIPVQIQVLKKSNGVSVVELAG